ncbi:lantibiotic dehydratase C-terminal domain-containing protein [Dactylosporangium sp. NPDC006015]|uniref:lantibiotic dehydratase C-terminal domain-containing protein n=1 Tax=Dactylosporangium sp. NPDC006015 TaxID=3154576 RepID=UPI0033A0FCA2
MSGHDWLSIHLFQRGDLDPLLIDLVPALLDELREEKLAEDLFFLRYWEGGNHLRLRVRPAPGASRRRLAARLGGRCRDHLSGRPVTGEDSQAAYAHRAALAARWEGRSGYARRLRPENTAHFVPYRRETERYGTGAAMEAVERHFVESSLLALRVLPRTPPAQRLTVALCAILTTWLVCQPDPATLAPLLRIMPDPVTATDDAYARQHDRLMSITGQVRRVVAGTGTLPPGHVLGGWATSVTRLRDGLTAELTAGRFAPPARGWEGTGAAGDGVLPVLDICAHLLCNRLGLTVGQEAYVRHMAVRAVHELEAA